MNFSFRLRGKELIGLYIAWLILYVLPQIAMHVLQKQMQADPKNMATLGIYFGLVTFSVLTGFLLIIPIQKKFTNNTFVNGLPLNFSGKISEYFWLNVGNLLLSIITIGIYAPWYLTELMKYQLGRISYNGTNLQFNGKGSKLLVVILLTLIVPGILFALILPKLLSQGFNVQSVAYAVGFPIAIFIFMIPSSYLFYKWLINISYKEYSIGWETMALPSIGKIFLEIFLSIITVGIYFPVALAKLYEYFAAQTVFCKQGAKVYSLSAKFDYLKVWKTVWAQVLLTIVTCGIYGAWGVCKVGALVVDNTVIKKIDGV